MHKTDAGGVRLGLEGAEAVRAAARRDRARRSRAPGTGSTGFVVQPMAPAGVELIVGVVHDHSFGPVLACGAGGTTAELISDVAVRITPVTDVRAARDAPLAADVPAARRLPRRAALRPGAIEDVLLRVSAMVEAHPRSSSSTATR